MTSARRRGRAPAPKWISPLTGLGSRLWTKRKLGDWRLRNRMLLLVLVPLIAIIPLAGVRVFSAVGNLRSAAHIQGQAQLARQVSTLVSALDDERDLTQLALTGSGTAKDDKLAAAQQATNAQVKAFGQSLDEHRSSVDALPAAVRLIGVRAEARLGDLTPLRASTKGLAHGANTPTFSAYSTIIGNLLDFSQQLAAVGSDHTLGSLVTTLASIEQIEQQTSSERGFIVDALDRGFTLELKENIEQAHFETANGTFTNNASTSLLNLYQSTVSGDKVGAADGTIQVVATAAQEDIPLDSLGITKATAFQQITDKLDAVRTVERQTVADLNDRSSHLLSAVRTQLYQNIAIIVAVVALSFLGALILARSVVRPLRQLRVSALDVADNRLPGAVRRLRDVNPSETDRPVRVEPIEVQSQDEVGQVARAFDRVHFEAVRLATEQARMRSNVNAIFTNLSRRSESLVLRQLQLIDDLENSEQDPGQLTALFQLDHLATRMRRNNENLLVLAGEEQSRRWDQPVSLFDLVRAATAEVEQYERVVLYELPDVAVVGHAATDVVHLMAEIIENATTFSGPETQVLVGAKMLTAGDVVLDIADAGIGIRPEELERINRRLAEPPVLDVAISRRMGLFVVGRLAAKYGIQVRLTSTGRTGLNALIRIPLTLLVSASELEVDGPQVFDQSALRPGPYDTGETAGLPGGGVAAGQAGDPRFDGPYGPAGTPSRGRSYDDVPAGRHSGQPDGGFPWFHDQEEGGGPDGDFSWFASEEEEAEAVARLEGHGSDRLPIFDAMRSQWPAGQGPQQARPPQGHVRPQVPPQPQALPHQRVQPPAQRPQPLPQPQPQAQLRPQAQPRPPVQPPGNPGHPSPSWARPGPEDAGGQATGGTTAQGLPRRVPLNNLSAEARPRGPVPQPNAAPTAPRAANLMRDRLSNFHQGVRQGKDGSDREGPGRTPGGSGPL
ncbi:nitrate- and nitrite sensing domain-containing protein [Streptomyces sp. NPDC003300]|uniref:sensor histidine kinase n=1 Tax=unclassified Streptomyces TaxID=2593676 RepID=UPI00339E775E